MAASIDKIGWLRLYTQIRRPEMFLSRLFTVKPGGIYTGEKVTIDIQRFGEDVAVAIKKCTGVNLNDFDEFTTKEFIPPAYGEGFPLDVCDLLQRMAGVDEYSAAYMSIQSQLISKMAQGFLLVEDMIKRAVELQASQILQTGELTLTDNAGNTVYTIDFFPKATHFPTAGVGWATVATATPLDDLASLATVIRADGQIDPNMVIMGATALRNFLKNAEVKDQLDNRRMELGEIAPRFANSGGTQYGNVWVDNYRIGIWTYPGTYKHPQTGTVTKFVDDDKVVMLSDQTRLDKASSLVPLPLGPDPRVASLLPGRLSSTSEGFDITPNVYPTPNGKQIMGEVESRTLLIPVQIDGFGCLDTQP